MGTITREVFVNARGEHVPPGDPSVATIEIEVRAPDGTTTRTYLERRPDCPLDHDHPELPTHLESTATVCDYCGTVVAGCDTLASSP
jgi:hypothetical protein